MHKGFFVDYSVTNARNARAEEAATVLKYYSNHDIDGGRLLDIGCGNGSTTQWFSQHLNTYTVGIEIEPAWDSISRHGNTKMEFLSASGIKLPFKSKSFHTIILNDVLEHVSYRKAKELFVEIGRVLDDEGQVYVSVANKFQIREPHSNLLFVSWLPRWIYAPIVRKLFRDDVCPYTNDRFGDLAAEADFESENFTWFYVSRKIQDVKYVGNTMLRPALQILNKIGATSSLGFKKFLESFAVLIFTCRKRSLEHSILSPTINFQGGLDFGIIEDVPIEEKIIERELEQ